MMGSDPGADAGIGPGAEATRGAAEDRSAGAQATWGDREAAEIAAQLGGLAASGVALPGALRAMAEEAESRSIRLGLIRVAERLEGGTSLGEAIEAEGRRVPGHFAGVVRAAERSGRLPEVLAEASRIDRLGDDLRRQILLRLAYPTLLIAAFLLIFQILSAFVVKDYAAIYRDFGVDLPQLSRWLLGIAAIFERAGWALPAAIALAFLAVWLAARGSTRSNRRRIASGIPLVGGLWRDAALAEFAGLLALLIEARLPMPEALVVAADGVRDVDLRSACGGVAAEVERGRTLADASRIFRLFPRGFDRLLAWAEAHDALPDALRMAAEVYRARDRTLAVLIGVYATAAAVTLVMLGVFLIVLGLYLPMIKLMGELTGGPFLLG